VRFAAEIIDAQTGANQRLQELGMSMLIVTADEHITVVVLRMWLTAKSLVLGDGADKR
jgi:hypothetical protein